MFACEAQFRKLSLSLQKLISGAFDKHIQEILVSRFARSNVDWYFGTDVGDAHDVIQVHVRQKHPFDGPGILFDKAFGALMQSKSSDVHHRIDDTADGSVIRILEDDLADTAVNKETTKTRMIQNVKVDLDVFVATRQPSSLGLGIVEIDEPAPIGSPVRRNYLLKVNGS